MFNILKTIVNIIFSKSNPKIKVEKEDVPHFVEERHEDTNMIKNPIENSTPKLSVNFTWHEALYLPSWKVEHIPTEQEKTNIIQMAQKMEQIRSILGNRSISVSCWIRPKLNQPGHPEHGQDYNLFVGSTAKASMHISGSAVDFVVPGMSSDQVREILVPHLKELNIRLENLPGSSWVHADLKKVSDERFRYFSV
jgi:hypothetical protein